MARKIFVAGTGQHCGKTTTSLSLLHLAQKKYQHVGFIKPVGPKPTILRGHIVDKDAVLMAQVFGLHKYLRFMTPVPVFPDTTRRVIDGNILVSELEDRICHAIAELEKRCDFIVIEGAGHPGVGSVLKLSNARIAGMLGAPVLLVTGGGVGTVIDAVSMDLALFEKEGADVRALLANKLITEKREKTLDYLRRGLAGESFAVVGGFDYQSVLADPTLRRISRLLGLPLQGNHREMGRIIHHLQIGAASTQRVTELLKDSSLIIVTSSRDELLVTLANLYQMHDYRARIAGLIIPGVTPVSTITQRIIDHSRIPYMRTAIQPTTELYRIITEDVSKTTFEDKQKLDLVRALAERSLDFDVLDALFAP
ncbi:MAG: dethiobiotin synthase [Desulfuromonadales bacterium]|nr:dethiobiotin synthase [Desulfuromonadales bacterium]